MRQKEASETERESLQNSDLPLIALLYVADTLDTTKRQENEFRLSRGVIDLPLPEEQLAAGSRIISLETIDLTETGRLWLTMFTFLRLQFKSYNGQQAYKVTHKFKLRRKLQRCEV